MQIHEWHDPIRCGSRLGPPYETALVGKLSCDVTLITHIRREGTGLRTGRGIPTHPTSPPGGMLINRDGVVWLGVPRGRGLILEICAMGTRTMTEQNSKLWGSADAYQRYMGRWSRKVARLFTDWLGAPQGKSWADIGCGTGELSLQIAGTFRPSRLVGIDSAAAFIARAANSVPSAEFREGNATNIDLPDGSFDYAVSGLVLNFIPDKAKALSEMARIVCPGGVVALYVWDYAGHMQIMRQFFDAARAIDPGSSSYDAGITASICRPKRLLGAFSEAGLSDPQTTAIDITAAFVDFQDYWTPFLSGTGTAPKYCMSLNEETRNTIRDAVRENLPTGPDGEILLAVRAWAVKGTVPA